VCDQSEYVSWRHKCQCQLSKMQLFLNHWASQRSIGLNALASCAIGISLTQHGRTYRGLETLRSRIRTKSSGINSSLLAKVCKKITSSNIRTKGVKAENVLQFIADRPCSIADDEAGYPAFGGVGGLEGRVRVLRGKRRGCVILIVPHLQLTCQIHSWILRSSYVLDSIHTSAVCAISYFTIIKIAGILSRDL
jgi:hypothetical protein